MRFLPPPSEGLVQKAILDSLAWYRAKCQVWRNNTGGMQKGERYIEFGLGTGGADIVGLVCTGRFFAIEVKAEKGKMSPEQIEWNARVRAMGGYVVTVRTVEEAVAAIDAAIRGDRAPEPEEVVHARARASAAALRAAPGAPRSRKVRPDPAAAAPAAPAGAGDVPGPRDP
jgi:hypothetical protein